MNCMTSLTESKEKIDEQEKEDEVVAWNYVKKCEDVEEIKEQIKVFESLKRKGLLTGHSRRMELELMRTALHFPRNFIENVSYTSKFQGRIDRI